MKKHKENHKLESKKTDKQMVIDYQNDDRKFFYCYSERLERFLYLFGKMYVSKGINPKGNTVFYVYKRDDELNFLLKEWSIIKEKITMPFK